MNALKLDQGGSEQIRNSGATNAPLILLGVSSQTINYLSKFSTV